MTPPLITMIDHRCLGRMWNELLVCSARVSLKNNALKLFCCTPIICPKRRSFFCRCICLYQQSTTNAQGTRVQQGSVDRTTALFQTSSREPAQHPRPVYKRWSPSGELLCAAMFAQCWTMDPVLDPERDNADPAWPVLARPEQSFYGVSDHNKGARRHCFNILPWWLLNQYKMRRLTERKKMNKKLRQKLNKVLSWFWERQNHTLAG